MQTPTQAQGVQEQPQQDQERSAASFEGNFATQNMDDVEW